MQRLLFFALFACVFFSCKKETEQPQRQVQFSAVQLINYPATNQGENWDSDNAFADPYFEVVDKNANVVYRSAVLTDQHPASVIEWNVPFVLPADELYVIRFFDEDGDIDTYMEDMTFTHCKEWSGDREQQTYNAPDLSQISVVIESPY